MSEPNTPQNPASPPTPSFRRAAPYSYYFFWNFGFINILFTFLPLYLSSIGYSLFQVSLAVSCLSLSSATAPLGTARLVARGSKPRRLVVIFVTLAFLAYAPLLVTTSAAVVLPAIGITFFLLTAALSLVDGAALQADIHGQIHYGHTRIWGSVGFVLVTAALGTLVAQYSLAVVPTVAIACLIGVISGAIVVGNALTGSAQTAGHSKHRLGANAAHLSITRRNQGLLGVAIFLQWASIAIMGSYLSLQFRAIGWDAPTISAAWNVAILAEMVALFIFHRLEAWISVRHIFSLSCAAAVVRWAIVAASSDLRWLFVAQTLQAWTFAFFHIAALKLLYSALPPSARGRTQPLYQLIGPGLGAITGSILGGVVARLNGPHFDLTTLFWGASAAGCVAMVCALAVKPAPAE